MAAALVLTNNTSDTRWYQALLMANAAICIVRGRMRFLNRKNNKTDSAMQGQTIFYLGTDLDKFYQYFSPFGVIMVPFRAK